MDTRSSGIAIDAVHKTFGGREVLAGATLEVARGEIVGLLGSNGAGKTTLIAIATGILAPDRGHVRVDGIPPTGAGFAQAVGCAPQETGTYPTLTLRENLAGFARLYGLRGRTARRRVDELVEALDLVSVADRRAGELSGGQRRRLHTAMALLHRPTALFLDEPTVAADVVSRGRIVELVRALADDGAAVVYTTHHLDEVERLGAEVALLGEGRIRRLGPVERVVARWGATEVAIRLRTVPDADRVRAPWRRAGDWLVGDADGIEPARLLRDALRDLEADGAEVVDVDIRRSSLENAYLRLVHPDAPARLAEGADHAAA